MGEDIALLSPQLWLNFIYGKQIPLNFFWDNLSNILPTGPGHGEI